MSCSNERRGIGLNKKKLGRAREEHENSKSSSFTTNLGKANQCLFRHVYPGEGRGRTIVVYLAEAWGRSIPQRSSRLGRTILEEEWGSSICWGRSREVLEHTLVSLWCSFSPLRCKSTGESCGVGTLVTLENMIRAKNLKYSCYDVFGDPRDMSQVQALSTCASKIIRAVQGGMNVTQRPSLIIMLQSPKFCLIHIAHAGSTPEPDNCFSMMANGSGT